MNTLKTTLLSLCHKPIRFFGIVTCASFACFSIVLAVAYMNAGSLDQESVQRLVRQASDQRVRALQFSIDTLSLDRAVRTQTWDRVEPALSDLISNHNAWVNTFETLRAEPANDFHAAGDEDSIAGYYTRLTHAYADVSQSIDELRVVGQSIVRRAPFIDPASEQRLTAAVESYQAHETRFNRISSEILALYQLQAQQAAGNNSASIRKALGFMLASMVIALGLGIAPRLHSLRSKISSLESDQGSHPNHKITDAQTDQQSARKAA
tara:strand:- start:20578 stop:21375 length:798 start_codon:yes stop_codon:yes gene_type:complete